MNTPRTLAELEEILRNQVEESIHLDFKESSGFTKGLDSVRKDLAKDVSSFANADGGLILYGVVEKDRLPIQLDGGVDHMTWTAERLENIVSGNIAPRLSDVAIEQIRASATHSYYAISIGKSFRGPHQSTIEKRYFKRRNFKAEPMEDYEIRDVLNRRDVVLPLVSVDVDVRWGAVIDLIVRNIGDIPAEDVRFSVTPPIEKLKNAKLINEGTDFLPPGKTFRYFIASAHERISKESALRFDVEVSYVNRRAPSRIVETFHFDLSDFLYASIVDSDVARLSVKLQESLKGVATELSKIRETLSTISTIAGGTGLDISVRTLRNMQRIAKGEPPERLPAHGLSWAAFAEVLNIDFRTAQTLSFYASYGEGRLDDVEGLTPEVVAAARAAFIFDESESSSA